MSLRIGNAVGIALSLAVLLASSASAKGSFAFITVSSPGLESDVWLNDRNLTEDWFAFADFQHGEVPAPSQPPQGGYLVTRYYIDGMWRVAFDELHYYPAAGLVYYDGIHNGSSEYDGKWYAANPAIRGGFEQAVLARSLKEAALRVPFHRKS